MHTLIWYNSKALGENLIISTLVLIAFFIIISFAYYLLAKNEKTQKRDLSYLFYCLYCLNMFLLFGRNWLIENNSFPTGLVPCNLILMTMPVLLYSGFIYHFIDDINPENIRYKIWLGNFFKGIAAFLLLYNLVFFVLLAISGATPFTESMISRYPFIGVSIGYVAIFFVFTRIKSNLIIYIILGSIGIATGAALSEFFGESPKVELQDGVLKFMGGKNTNLQPIFQIGALFDIVIIAIALIKKNTLNTQWGKDKVQQELRQEKKRSANLKQEKENLHQTIQELVKKLAFTSAELLPNNDKNLLEKITQIVLKNINDPQFNIDSLCKAITLSRSQLHRKLKEFTNLSTSNFIHMIRLNYAKQLLETTDKNVSEVAYEVGYEEANYFSKLFKKEFGFPPSDLKK